jgi:hypothetical protein
MLKLAGRKQSDRRMLDGIIRDVISQICSAATGTLLPDDS